MSYKCITFDSSLRETKTTKTMTNNIAIDQFIIEMTLVSPIEKIISQLQSKDFRDCDIKWLDAKLDAFTDLACKTLGINFLIVREAFTMLNDYVIGKYLNYFNTLLAYFKTI